MSIRIRLKLIIILSLCTVILSSQQEDERIPLISNCGLQSDFVYPQQIQDQGYEKRYQKNIQGKSQKNNIVYRLPTVVHIVHDGSALGTEVNPTDAQIFAQIQSASDRFRHQQPGAGSYDNILYGADTEIELCMAKIDPDGNFTSGVIRYYDPINTVDPTQSYMSSIIWDPTRYNNIILAKSINGNCGTANGTYTWYLASCFNPGLICHEIGHHLSLAHTFSGSCNNSDCTTDGDRVCDTPPKPSSGYNFNINSCADPGNSCTSDEDDLSNNNPYRPISSGGIGDQPDMYANYMDYTGSCWDSFTKGQKDRMRFNLTDSRSTLYENASACDGPSMASLDVGISNIDLSNYDFCNPNFNPTITISNYGSSTINKVTVIFELNGITSQTVTLEGITISSEGTYEYTLANSLELSSEDSLLTIRTTLPNDSPDMNIFNDENYAIVSFLGGDLCEEISQCADFNTSTSSGPGNTTLIAIMGNFPQLNEDLTSIGLCVSVEGDVSNSFETFNVSIEEEPILGQTAYGADCNGTFQACFKVHASAYSNWVNDEVIIVKLDPINSSINPSLCLTNRACATIYIPKIQLDPCDGIVLNLSGDYNNNNIAKNHIEANGTITNGQHIIFQANDSILLKQNFSVEANAIFEALLADCEIQE